MHSFKIVFFSLAIFVAGVSSSFAERSPQLGVGYGIQFKDNSDLGQYELFWRQPLPYKTTLGDNWNLTTNIEIAAALIRESGSGHTGTGRFSIMPQVVLSPHHRIHFIVGIGVGFLAGATEFSNVDLGGTFLLNSKLGMQFSLTENWGLEYAYYHQSNAGIYDGNDGLNMHHLSIVYTF